MDIHSYCFKSRFIQSNDKWYNNALIFKYEQKSIFNNYKSFDDLKKS